MHVFISHSHEDNSFVERLATDLMWNKARVWVDTWHLRVGDSLVDKIEGAIDSAYGLVVVLSKASTTSEWCRKELTSGLVKELEKRNVFVFPIVIDDCDLPLFLRGKLYADFRRSYEEGLKKLLVGLSPHISPTQNRSPIEGLHNDWNLVDVASDGHVVLMINCVTHSKDHEFSILTEFLVRANDQGSRMFSNLEQRGLKPFAINAILDLVRKLRSRKELAFSLDGSVPQVATFSVANPVFQVEYEVRCMAMLLGRNPGRPVFLDFAEVFGQICESFSKCVREPSQDEAELLSTVLAQYRVA